MSKRPNSVMQESFVLSYDHAQLTANTAIKLFKPSRAFRIDAVRYVNVTGLAADVTDFFDVQVLIEAAVSANWLTETGEEGTIAANTWVDATDGAAADMVGAADDEIILNFVEGGTATLPAGRVQIEGRYL